MDCFVASLLAMTTGMLEWLEAWLMERRSEAIQIASAIAFLDCFAEPVICHCATRSPYGLFARRSICFAIGAQ